MGAASRSGRKWRLRGGWIAVVLVLGCQPPSGTLVLRITDGDTGEVTPARVEIRNAEGEPVVAPDALTVTQACLLPPFPEWAEPAEALRRAPHIDNPHTGTRQFYLARPSTVPLPPGRYRMRVFKGIEHRVAERAFEVRQGQSTHLVVPLERWIDFPARGWVAADGHLHITRRHEADDWRIGRWMQAEDLQVANLLQMGTAGQFGVTPQYAFGDAGAHREGGEDGEDGTLLLSGQEHPRTHFFGHAIVLGARAPSDLRESYTVYGRFFERARELDGSAGYAHWGLGPARRGLAVDAPSGLVDFVEVLQFEYAHYGVWYELLSAGLRVAPVAGTDFPCGPWSLPGRERFYTRVEGTLDRAGFVTGVRRGRTFVTNGPLLEFELEPVGRRDELLTPDQPRPARTVVGIGDDLALEEPGPVRLTGAVHFDPARDDVKRLELVHDGEVVLSVSERIERGVIGFDVTREVTDSGWYALRAAGDKVGETPLRPYGLPEWVMALGERYAGGVSIAEREAFAAERAVRPSRAHTAAIRVRVPGDERAVDLARAGARARRLLERLREVEARLSEERIDDAALWELPYGDGVDAETLRRDRPAILAAVAQARAYYESLLADAEAASAGAADAEAADAGKGAASAAGEAAAGQPVESAPEEARDEPAQGSAQPGDG